MHCLIARVTVCQYDLHNAHCVRVLHSVDAVKFNCRPDCGSGDIVCTWRPTFSASFALQGKEVKPRALQQFCVFLPIIAQVFGVTRYGMLPKH